MPLRIVVVVCLASLCASVTDASDGPDGARRRAQTTCNADQQSRLDSLDAAMAEQETGMAATIRSEALNATEELSLDPEAILNLARRVNGLGPL